MYIKSFIRIYDGIHVDISVTSKDSGQFAYGILDDGNELKSHAVDCISYSIPMVAKLIGTMPTNAIHRIQFKVIGASAITASQRSIIVEALDKVGRFCLVEFVNERGNRIEYENGGRIA